MLALIDAFHKELSDIRELSDSTVENYTYTIVDYFNFAKNKLKIDPVYSQGHHILQWMTEVRKNGLGNSRLKNHRVALKTFFDLLIKLKIIRRNPAEALPQIRKTPSERNNPVPKKVAYKLLRSIDQASWHGQRNFLIIAMLWALGLRVGELTSLKVKSFEPDHDSGNKIGLLRVRGKNRQQRALFIVDHLYDVLTKYLALPQSPKKKNDPLFPIEAGTAISTDRVYKMIKDYCQSAKIKNRITPHVLRHSFATDMYHQGVPLQAIQAMMGHSKIAETSIYIHVSGQLRKQALEYLSIQGEPLWG